MPKRYVAGWNLVMYFTIPAVLGLLAYYLTANSYIASFYLFLIMFGFITSGLDPVRMGIYSYGFSEKTKGSKVLLEISWGVVFFFIALVAVMAFKAYAYPNLPFQSIANFLLPQADIYDAIGKYFAVYAAPVTSYLLKLFSGTLVIYFVAFAEELAFRGPMFMATNESFERKWGFAGVLINVIIWSAIFAFFHIVKEWYTSGMGAFTVKGELFYTIFVIGLVWSLARVFTKSLIPTITAHFAWDFLAMNNVIFLLWR